MSNQPSNLRVDVVGVNDPLSRFAGKQNPYSTVLIGNDTFIPSVLSSSSVSNSNISFATLAIPNMETFIDRRINITNKYRITFVGKTTTTGLRLLQTGYDALRAMPINGSIGTINMTINTNNFTSHPSDYVKEILRFNRTPKDLSIDFGGTAAMLDNTQNYADTAETNRNPLAKWADNPYIVPRGGAVQFSYVDNPASVSTTTPVTAVIEFSVTEPLVISPCVFNTMKTTGLYGIQNMKLDINFKGPLDKYMWSHNAANTSEFIASVDILESQLEMMFASPRLSERMANAGLGSVYPYVDMYPYIHSQSSMAANETRSLRSKIITLSSVPEKVFIFVREKESLKTMETTDTYMRINNLSLGFGTKYGLLSGASNYQLYQMSARNGYYGTYQDWSGATLYENIGATESTIAGSGSVLCLGFGTDIDLSEDQAPGTIGNFQLSVDVNCTNINSTRSILPDIYVIVSQEGSLNIINGQTTTNISNTTLEDIHKVLSEPRKRMDYYDSIGSAVGGSKFFDFLKKAGTWLVKYGLPVALPIIGKVLGGKGGSIIPKGGAIVPKGSGMTEMGGSKTRKGNKGMKGGRQLSPQDFMNTLKR